MKVITKARRVFNAVLKEPTVSSARKCAGRLRYFSVSIIISNESCVILRTLCMMIRIGIHDEIFHFEIFKNFMKILKFFETPSLKYFKKFLIFIIK